MRYKFSLVIFIVIYLGFSCNPKVSYFIEGKYCTEKNNKIKNIFSPNIYRKIIGVELNLYKDSTFEYIDCANIIKGRWRITNIKDSLILFCEQYKSISKKTENWSYCANSSEPYMIFKILENGILIDTIKTKELIALNILTKCK